jgi:hypothetical protein
MGDRDTVGMGMKRWYFIPRFTEERGWNLRGLEKER